MMVNSNYEVIVSISLSRKHLSVFRNLKCLAHSKSEHKEAISTAGVWKSLIFQVLVLMKEIMTGNLSVVVVCPLQRNVYD